MSYHIFLLESLHLEQWLCGHVHVVINIGDFNIGEFSEKLPITNINSLPINHLVRYTVFVVLSKGKKTKGLISCDSCCWCLYKNKVALGKLRQPKGKLRQPKMLAATATLLLIVVALESSCASIHIDNKAELLCWLCSNGLIDDYTHFQFTKSSYTLEQSNVFCVIRNVTNLTQDTYGAWSRCR